MNGFDLPISRECFVFLWRLRLELIGSISLPSISQGLHQREDLALWLAHSPDSPSLFHVFQLDMSTMLRARSRRRSHLARVVDYLA